MPKMKCLPPFQNVIHCNTPGLSGHTYEPYVLPLDQDPQRFGRLDDVDLRDAGVLTRQGWVQIVDADSAQEEIRALKARLDKIEQHLGI